MIPVHEEYNGLKLRFSAIRKKKHRAKKKNASQKWGCLVAGYNGLDIAKI